VYGGFENPKGSGNQATEKTDLYSGRSLVLKTAGRESGIDTKKTTVSLGGSHKVPEKRKRLTKKAEKES